MKLPDKIKSKFAKLIGADVPVFSFRALTNLEGNLGETYVLSDKDSVLFCSGNIGGNYKYFKYKFEEITLVSLETDRPFAYLGIRVENLDYRLKFPAYDLDQLNELINSFNKNKVSNDRPQSLAEQDFDESKLDLTPLVGFCALLYAVANMDGKSCENELKNLSLIINDDHILKRGFDYWKGTDNIQIVEELKSLLTSDQKICLLANMLEVTMVDGVLNENEKMFLEKTRLIFNINTTKFNAIFDALYAKNNFTSFYNN